MSFFSLVNVGLVMIILPCIFFFHPLIFLLVLLIWFLVFLKLVGEDLLCIKVNHKVGFWLFLLSEAIIFSSLLTCCLWFQTYDGSGLAYPYFIPLIETVLLVSSSFFISAYHNLLGCSNSNFYLILSVLCSFMFMFLAGYEVLDSLASSLFNPYLSTCYMTVGLHFSHVLLGSILLVQLFWFFEFPFIRRSSDMYILYWHFVDYIWLFVFTIVYLCT